jgi:Flp pilus assembly protein TadG
LPFFRLTDVLLVRYPFLNDARKSGRDMGMKRLNSRISAGRFLRDQSGSQTLEAVIWLPIFFTMLALVINVSMVFFDQSQIMRVVQNANRAIALGTFTTTTEVEEYIIANLAYMTDTLEVSAAVSGSFVTTTVVVPALELMPVNFLSDYFSDTKVTVIASHLVES